MHDADSVEVEVAAVPFRRLRVKDVSSLHAKVAFEKVGDLGLFKICAQCTLERRTKLVLGEMADGKQILLHPNGIPDAKSWSAVSDVMDVSNGIQSEAERIFPRCSIRTPSSASANAGNRKPPPVQMRNAQRASLRLIWFDT